MANTNDRDSNNGNILNLETDDRSDEKDFEVSDQGQNLGGGTGDEKTISVGTSDSGFNKTDQSISQAAPGQTATNNNQGGSNA